MGDTPWLFVIEDPKRNIALLRGEGAAETAKQIGNVHQAVAGYRPRWSVGGRGYVIRRDLVLDAVGYAHFLQRPVVQHERRESAA